MHNQVVQIKQGAKKRVATSYQQPNFHTLENLNKKMKLESHTTSQGQPSQSIQPSQIKTLHGTSNQNYVVV